MMQLPPKKQLRRIHDPHTARFLTFSCYRRLPLFSNDSIKHHFVDHLSTCLDGISLLAWVVMPNHAHIVIDSTEATATARFLSAVKRPFSREVINRWRTLHAPILPRLRDRDGKFHFWQAGGGYDRNVNDSELIQKIRYIHQNPVRRGLVQLPEQWKWSSARSYSGMVTKGPKVSVEWASGCHGELL